MCRRLTFLISFVLLLALVGNASAMVDIEWDDGDPNDHLWSSPLNWSNNQVPWVIDEATEDGVCTHIESGFALANSPIVDDSVIKADPCTGSFSLGVYVGAWGSGDANLTMTGGYINAVWEFACGAFHVDANGTFYMSGGLIETGYLAMGCCGTGNLYMTGGVIDTNGGPFAMPGDIAEWLPKCTGTGTGHVNLDGGTIIAGSIFMQEPSTMDVNGGTLTILGDARAIIAQYAGLGWITGAGSTDPRNVGVVYDDVNDLTIVTYDPTPDLTVPWQPSPGMGSTGVYWKPTLSWQPGCYADTHTVYFGSSLSDVNESATPVSVNQPGMTYPINNFLEFGQTYYWRIDEVNDACAPGRWPGPVWYFTIGDNVAVDDFDSYADTSALRTVWEDYWGDGTRAEVFVEKTFVHDGNSMKYNYDNYVGGGGVKDRYSEIWANTADLEIGPDWNGSGDAKALVLYFYGDPCNAADPVKDGMYVVLEDADANIGMLKYPDMNAIQEASWHEWNIDLQDPCLSAVDVNNVAKVYIGFGVRGGSGAGQDGGWGTVYFDDIGLYPTRCVAEFGPAGDVTGECRVDYADVNVMARDWLLSDYIVTATEPNSKGLVGWWKLDEGEGADPIAYDSAGSNDGTLDGPLFVPSWEDYCGDPCHEPCLNLDGVGYVDIPSAAFADISDEITITLWQYGDDVEMTDTGEFFHACDAEVPFDLTIKGELFNPTSEGCEVWWDAGFGGANLEDSISGDAIPENYLGQWNHWAFVKNANAGVMKIYLNGELFASGDGYSSLVTGTDIAVFKIGSYYDGASNFYDGYMSDFRLYNYALSHGEVRYVAGQMDDLYVPLPTPAVDMYEDGKVNFKDYAFLANTWLMEIFWP